MTILAVGAAGRFAGSVIPALAQRNARVRGLVRKPEEIAQVREHGAAETVIGDLRDRASLDAALKDIEAVFYIAPAFMPNEAEVGKGLIDAAIRGGVRRLVFSNHIAKAPVEEAILTSKLEYTFLHPSRFYQNYEAFWPKVIETGVLAEPWSAETRFSLVDYRDIAEVAAIALTEDRLLYGTFELCAQGWHNRHDVTALIGEVLGREIKERRDPDVLDNVAQGQKTMFEHFDHHDLLGNPLILRTILGREPRSLKTFFEELAARSW